MSGPPPCKVFYSSLSAYTTPTARQTQVNILIDEFESTYDLYPTVIEYDAQVDCLVLGAYTS